MTNATASLDYASHHASRAPVKNKVLFIVMLFIIASITLMGLGYLQSETLNSVRAFVRGEGLWSKAQKDAVFHLERYAYSHDINDYTAFKTALIINLGDNKARLALSETPPNKVQAAQGFLEGDNHPDDIEAMMNFFIRFQNFYYLKQAIGIWTAGDEKIHDLIKLGKEIRQCILENRLSCLNKKIKKLKILNKELDKIATDFSLILSKGARWIKSTLLTIGLLIISFLSFIIFILTRRIIIELSLTEKELVISEQRFLSLFQSNIIGIIEWNINGEVLAANDEFLNMIGYSQEDVQNKTLNWRKLTPKESDAADKHAISELMQHGMCTPFEKEFIHKDGHRVPIYLGAALLNGEREKGICFVVDQSLQKMNETQLKLSATVFNASSNGIIITDKYKHVLTANQAYCKKTGVNEEDLVGSIPPVLLSNLMHETFFNDISNSLQQEDHWQGDAFDTTQNETIIPVHITINTVRDQNYTATHYVIVITDISEQKAAEEQLKKMAHHDYLTGLANRSLYNDRLNQALSRSKRSGSHCALLFFDLDKFKPINDEHGHEIGDLILQSVASRITPQIRDNDTMARLGGDEFVIIIEDLHEKKDAVLLAKKVIELISQPFCIKELELTIGCSLGICISPEHGTDIITLTRKADIAMYAAKSSGTNQYYIYHTSR